MPRNFRMTNVRRFASSVPNLSTVHSSPNVTPNEYLSNYKSYLEGATLASRTAIGSGKQVASLSPALMGPFPGWGMNTEGYSSTRIGAVDFFPDKTPQLTVAGTALATPANLLFSPWGGTGSLDNAVNSRATRLLRPIFVKVV